MSGHWQKRPDPDETGHDVYEFVLNPKPRHEKKFTVISWMSGEAIAEFDDSAEAKEFTDGQEIISFIPYGKRQHHARAYIEDRDRKIIYRRTDWEAHVAKKHPQWIEDHPLDEEYHASGTDLMGDTSDG